MLESAGSFNVSYSHFGTTRNSITGLEDEETDAVYQSKREKELAENDKSNTIKRELIESKKNRKIYLCCLLPLGNNGECYGVRWAFFLIFIGTLGDMLQGLYNLIYRFDSLELQIVYALINIALWCGPWPFMLYAFRCWENNYKSRRGL